MLSNIFSAITSWDKLNRRELLISKKILPWSMWGLAALFYCYAYFLRIYPSMMMRPLMDHFQINATIFGNLTAAYYFAYAPLQLPAGMILDRFNIKSILVGSCFVSICGLYIFSIADTLPFAMLGRFMIGCGCAFAYISGLKMATIWLKPTQFATAAGLTTAFGMGAASFSDIYLSQLVSSVGYKQTLSYGVILGCVVVVILFLGLSKKTQDKKTVHHSSVTFRELWTGVKLILRSKQMWIIGIIGLFLYLPASMFLDVWGIPFLETAYHLSATQSAFAVMMIFGGWIVASPLIGYISDRIRARRSPLLITTFIATIVISIVIYCPLNIYWLYSLLFIFGMMAGVHPLCFSLSRENNSNKIAGTATASTNAFIMFGGVIFQPLVGKLLDWHHHAANGISNYSIADYQFALSVLPLGLLLCYVLSFFVKETHCKIPD